MIACCYCKESFRLTHLIDHIRQKHPMNNTRVVACSGCEVPAGCCPYYSYGRAGMIKHIVSKHPEEKELLLRLLDRQMNMNPAFHKKGKFSIKPEHYEESTSGSEADDSEAANVSESANDSEPANVSKFANVIETDDDFEPANVIEIANDSEAANVSGASEGGPSSPPDGVANQNQPPTEALSGRSAWDELREDCQREHANSAQELGEVGEPANNATGQMQFRCARCLRIFPNASMVQEHMRQMHQPDRMLEEYLKNRQNEEQI
jgi:hypothetical protein